MPRWLTITLKILGAMMGVALVALALTLWGRREHWDTGTAVGVAGLCVAVGGFGVAIWEIRNARSAAQATEAAVGRTLKGVASVQLIRMIEHLRQAVVDLEDAVERKDLNGARRSIRAWRTIGADAKGPLERRFGATLPALEPLEKSITVARSAMAQLRSAESPPSFELAANCLDAMEDAVDQLGPLHEQLLPTMDQLDEHA